MILDFGFEVPLEHKRIYKITIISCLNYNLIMVFFFSQSSNMLNQARLKTLKVREDHVSDVLDEARKRLIKVTSNPELYREVLKKLILQAILQVSKQLIANKN